jgi:hypothetical protein
VIRLNDGKPWFRRWMWVGYRPITDEGRLLISLASGICLVAGAVAIISNGQSPLTETVFALAIVMVIATNAIAFFKMEDGF